jgi:hypothetical protein
VNDIASRRANVRSRNVLRCAALRGMRVREIYCEPRLTTICLLDPLYVAHKRSGLGEPGNVSDLYVDVDAR